LDEGENVTNRQFPDFSIVHDCGGLENGIAEMTREAFSLRYGSGAAEVSIVESLRRDGAVVAELALVAKDRVAGHAMFSRMTVEPPLCRAAALGPVSARVRLQHRGIGTALIRAGIDACAQRGVEAIFVLGDPGYYGRFGFDAAAAAGIRCDHAGPHFQALTLRAGALRGVESVAYARAFGAV
jgi:putative acetyltransferase